MVKKRVLLIGGGGTLGAYTAQELLCMNCQVDTIALEDLTSLNRNLTYYKGKATDDLLKSLFAKYHYDAIVDFLLYTDVKAYKERAKLLLANTEQLLFLSSYRTYGDQEHPIRESSPQIYHVTTDEYFLAHEDYAVPKSICEEYLRSLGTKNWTILRPLISFSRFRLDLVTLGAGQLLLRALSNRKILLPLEAKEKTAGLNWAGDSGKQIAHLCLNEKAMGEDFTIGTGEKRTWGEVAELYTELLGAEFVWVNTEDYLENATSNTYMNRCSLFHDRLLNREIDSWKMLAATGLTMRDFAGVRNGLIYELEALAANRKLMESFNTPGVQLINSRMDEYLEKHVISNF